MDCLHSAEESVPGVRQTHQMFSKLPIKRGGEVHVPVTVTSRSVGILCRWLWWDPRSWHTKMWVYSVFWWHILAVQPTEFRLWSNRVFFEYGSWGNLLLGWSSSGFFLCCAWSEFLWFIRDVIVHCKKAFSVFVAKVIEMLEVKIVFFSL